MAVFVVIAIQIAGMALGSGGARPTASPTPPYRPDTGRLTYSVDFGPGSNWWTGISDGESAGIDENGYAVTVEGDSLIYIFPSPIPNARQQLSVAITGSESSYAAWDTGFGVECDRGTAASYFDYEFIVQRDGSWEIDRRFGESSTAEPIRLRSGVSNLGTTAVTVEGVCATTDTTTRLLLYINGSLVCDRTDTDATLPPGGWTGSLIVRSSAAPSTATFSHYEERDQSAPPPAAPATSSARPS